MYFFIKKFTLNKQASIVVDNFFFLKFFILCRVSSRVAFTRRESFKNYSPQSGTVILKLFCLQSYLPTGVWCSPHAVGPFLTSPGSAHSKLSFPVNGSTVLSRLDTTLSHLHSQCLSCLRYMKKLRHITRPDFSDF